MKLKIYTIEDQARGHFNNGEILENKPIGFPGDGEKTKTLFKYILLGSCVDRLKKVQLAYTLIKVLKFAVLY